ncbi:hypothetical protein PIROE2DRAFT_20138 [Piromyces sp. E2]|nr:hypothetical protein PIROE2DRAFT_20138 [Piromyces sp. E2]|eukprot:OUM66695.1 hypothetical protein PIROE2DRAFT_20138 [Piromyces sp. E2]
MFNIYILILKALIDKKYGKFESTINTPLQDVYSFTNFTGKNTPNELFIYFVLPQDQSLIDGNEFIERFKNDPDIIRIIDKTCEKKSVQKNIKYIPLKSEQELEEESFKDKKNNILAGVVFKENFTNYTIRIKGSDIVNSKEKAVMDFGKSRKSEYIEDVRTVRSIDYRTLYVEGHNPEIKDFNNSKTFGNNILYYKGYTKADTYINTFIPIQIAIDNIIIQSLTNGTVKGYTASLGKLSKPEAIFILNDEDNREESFDGYAQTINFLYIAPMLHLIFSIMKEKESGVKDGLISVGANLILSICLLLTILYAIDEPIYKLKLKNYDIIEKILSLLISPMGISMALANIIFENNRNGYIGFSNLFKNEFVIYLIFLIIDVVFYFLIATFIDSLNDWNIRKFGLKPSHQVSDDNVSHALDIQEDPLGSECYVQVRNIYKYFRFRKKYMNNNNNNDGKIGKIFTVNNNISFNAYKDEIFAILGHNGAGKSTLIKIMIGMMNPESGETFYNGLPLSQNKKAVQYHMGICLQNNVLIKGFTVAEHYILYTGIKEVVNELDTWLKDIDLLEKRNCEVQYLSTGQKRKLCIGLAFIGDPKYVFLDEPTTGLDPLSRQKIWRLLMKKKRDRVIFITTHYMDEADIIADRKLILNKGTIRCLGSSVYLKKHFQMRYNLEVETNDPQSVEEIIKYYVPEAEYFNDKTKVEEHKSLPTNITSSHIWKLAIDSSPLFSYLIKHLEEEKRKGDILRNFSVGAPRLEELFVYLDRENEVQNTTESKQQNTYEPSNMLLDKEIKKENKSETFKDLAIELPNDDSNKKPNDFIIALRLVFYRLKFNYRRKLFLGISLILPFTLMGISFTRLNINYSGFNYSKFEEHMISSSLYSGHKWNYDVDNSETIKNNINLNVLQQQPSNLNSLTIQKSDKLNELICEKNYTNINTSPHESYYVSSFSGELIDNKYNFSIYYNDSMPHSIPSTLNSLCNAILTTSSYNNNTIQIGSHPLPYFKISDLLNVNYNTVLIIMFCLSLFLALYGSNVVNERKKKLLKQLQLNDAIFPCYGFIRVIKNCMSIGMEYNALKNDSISWQNLIFSLSNENLCHFIGAVFGIVLYSSLFIITVKNIYTPSRDDVYELSKEHKDSIEQEMKNQDEDVYYEYERVKSDIDTNEIPIKLVNLLKEYNDLKFNSSDDFRKAMKRTKGKYGEYHISVVGKNERRQIVTTAFENINLGIDKCECFGLLGPNGSGKTSLLNTVSFTFKQTAGDILYEGKNTLDRKANEITLGYCPQENTLWEEMTLYEHIKMFLYIRGCSRAKSKRLADQFIEYCRLTPHKNKFPSEMSGGTRRKLNILIALCCNSQRALLDEPSSGMDPASRRYIWEVIKATLQRNQSSMIMTTHSMEEAELLCNRIGIIVNGKIQCIGTPEHLKMKFGHTYILDVHTENVERFHKEVVVAFNLFGIDSQYKRDDISQQRVKYEIQHNYTSDISRVFEIMEACRDVCVDGQNIYVDYSYSQTTLEEVFINFACLKENHDDDDDVINDSPIM